jgi:hypothetical protein
MGRDRGPALALLLGLLAGLAAFALGRRVVHSPVGSAEVTGQVVAEGRPLAGALVRVKGSAVTARADSAGRFRLPFPTSPSARITAWHEGHLIGGARLRPGPLTLRLSALPGDDHDAYEWVGPTPRPGAAGNCGNCHAEVYREWAASGHARSATGRHFRNLYEGTDWHGRPDASWGLLREHPDGSGVCTACHAPTVRDADEALFDLTRVRGLPALGVHCDYCHKVTGADDTSGLTHGRFNLRLLRPKEGQLFFGPLDDVDRGEDAYSPFYRDSRYCAACHEGVVFGVRVYSTYSEWLASPAARAGLHCQDCHMAPTGKMTNVAPGRGGIERAAHTLGNHRFFDGGLEAMLRRCVRVSATLRGGTAHVKVWAEGAGHRVPTGYIDRHLLLVVEGLGAGEEALPLRAGPTLPAAAGAELAGRPGRLYGRVLKDFAGHSPAPFWLADSDPADTRLAPGRVDEAAFVFWGEVERVRVRVHYRRFWREVARAKGWPDRDLVVVDRAFGRR